MNKLDLLIVVIAFLVSVAVTGWMRSYALRANMLDVPNHRSSHQVATPRGGGLSIVLVFVVAVITLLLVRDLDKNAAVGFLLGGSLVAGIGFVDDRSSISAKWRFLVQIIAAVIVVVCIGGLPAVQIGPLTSDFGVFGYAMAVIFAVWFTNAFNFMDGIDGIAASEAICIAVGGFVLASDTTHAASVLLAALSAATLGFLMWNWPPAKIFMGDVGSAFLGFILIGIALHASHEGLVSVWSWLILAGIFVVDATVTLSTRMVRRYDWLSAHRDHAYQKASRRYGSHARVTMAVVAINSVWLFPLSFLANRAPENGWWLTVVAWAPLILLSFWLGAGRRDLESSS
ncbi:MAG: glycosyltransferase family 4 protein [Gammaproteobacteria bacterium]|nr:glycosyltransferase family 4 protein [Gammaproteobacteria bacterium]